jgi:hypothetical protein
LPDNSTKSLRGVKIISRIVGLTGVFVGKVLTVEERGFWITSGTLVHQMLQDSAWRQIIEQINQPEIFVPFSSLTYLIAPKRDEKEQQQTPYVPDDDEISDNRE